jgi:hypothetical protein
MNMTIIFMNTINYECLGPEQPTNPAKTSTIYTDNNAKISDYLPTIEEALFARLHMECYSTTDRSQEHIIHGFEVTPSASSCPQITTATRHYVIIQGLLNMSELTILRRKQTYFNCAGNAIVLEEDEPNTSSARRLPSSSKKSAVTESEKAPKLEGYVAQRLAQRRGR